MYTWYDIYKIYWYKLCVCVGGGGEYNLAIVVERNVK